MNYVSQAIETKYNKNFPYDQKKGSDDANEVRLFHFEVVIKY